MIARYLERFQAKWAPVRVKKTRQIKKREHDPEKWIPVFRKDHAQSINWRVRDLAFAVVLTALTSQSARADAPKTDLPKAAVFDFELIDTSLEGEMRGPQADEKARLLLISNQIRKGLTESGQFDVLDIAPVNAAAHASNLQACGGCDVDLARKLGADLAVTGTISKVSTLILNMHIYIHDVATGRSIASMNADFRGNTDESWSRTASFLLRNRLLAPNYGVPR